LSYLLGPRLKGDERNIALKGGNRWFKASCFCDFPQVWTGFIIWRPGKEYEMSVYIALVTFTDQGVRHIKQTTERAKGLINAAANLKIKIKDIYWTMGAYDAVFTAEAPDDETMTAFAASMGALGNIRTQTMRAFSADEMNKILTKLPAMDVTTSK
jgi:uncharacterized protein with GYD domain